MSFTTPFRKSTRQRKKSSRFAQWDSSLKHYWLPCVGEDIHVKWELESETVWWPAIVLEV